MSQGHVQLKNLFMILFILCLGSHTIVARPSHKIRSGYILFILRLSCLEGRGLSIDETGPSEYLSLSISCFRHLSANRHSCANFLTFQTSMHEIYIVQSIKLLITLISIYERKNFTT